MRPDEISTGSVVLDRDRDAWQGYGRPLTWTCIHEAKREPKVALSTEELMAEYGPIMVIWTPNASHSGHALEIAVSSPARG